MTKVASLINRKRQMQERQMRREMEEKYMEEETKEKAAEKVKKDESPLPMNNIAEYEAEKDARKKRLTAYEEKIQKMTLQMSSELIAELVAERKRQKKTQQDIADITGILSPNLARFENGSRVPTLIVLQKYASALGKKITLEICDQ